MKMKVHLRNRRPSASWADNNVGRVKQVDSGNG